MERQGTPVIHHILPPSAPNRPGTRYGQKLDVTRGPLFITIHETGNPGSTAWNEINYLRSAEQQRRQASFHLAVDNRQIVQGLPLDEVGWHAGDGCDNLVIDTGCFRSIAIETCIGIDDMRTRRVLAECIARICAGDPAFDWGSGITRGKFDIDHLAQHNWFSDEGKDCPYRIRHEGFWPTLMTWVDEAWAVWGHGQTPKPEPVPTPPPPGVTYAPKRKPPKWTGRDVVRGKTVWRAVQRVVTALRETPRLQTATRNAKLVGPPIAAGESFVVYWVVENAGGKYYVTPSGTTVRAEDCTPDIEISDREAA